MQTATKALGLKTESSAQELEEALKKTINHAKNAEAELRDFEEKTKTNISVLEAKLTRSEKAVRVTQSEKDEALSALQASEENRVVANTANAEEVKKLKSQFSDKQKEIKQITKSLADTPENVVKKMKILKKDKMDEANARKRAEEVSRTLRKDKQREEQKVEQSKAAIERANELAIKHRELDTFANEQYNQLAEKMEDKKSLQQVPFLNKDLLEAIEAAAPKEEKDEKVKKEKKKK